MKHDDRQLVIRIVFCAACGRTIAPGEWCMDHPRFVTRGTIGQAEAVRVMHALITRRSHEDACRRTAALPPL